MEVYLGERRRTGRDRSTRAEETEDRKDTWEQREWESWGSKHSLHTIALALSQLALTWGGQAMAYIIWYKRPLSPWEESGRIACEPTSISTSIAFFKNLKFFSCRSFTYLVRDYPTIFYIILGLWWKVLFSWFVPQFVVCRLEDYRFLVSLLILRPAPSPLCIVSYHQQIMVFWRLLSALNPFDLPQLSYCSSQDFD